MFVCRCGVTAALADEFRLGDAVLGRCVTAALTPIRGVPGVDLDPGAPSVFRFGAQYRDKLAPASVTDRSVEPGLGPGTIGEELFRVSGSGFGFARRSIFAILRSSTTSRS